MNTWVLQYQAMEALTQKKHKKQHKQNERPENEISTQKTNTSPAPQEEKPGVLYSTYLDVCTQGLDNLKTATKETRGSRHLVPTESTTNIMDYKEVKPIVLQEVYTTSCSLAQRAKCQIQRQKITLILILIIKFFNINLTIH